MCRERYKDLVLEEHVECGCQVNYYYFDKRLGAKQLAIYNIQTDYKTNRRKCTNIEIDKKIDIHADTYLDKTCIHYEYRIIYNFREAILFATWFSVINLS